MALVTKKRAMLLIERIVWNVGNNKKKGSWEQATVGLMLFRCDYAETTIINYYLYLGSKKMRKKNWIEEKISD